MEGIDHVVIAVRDLAQAVADYEKAGFIVTPGGEHASGDTHNALLSFSDGSYFELLAFKEPGRPQSHRWWPRLMRGEGLVDFALGADDLTAEADTLRSRGLHVDGPADGGRVRPDGEQLRWRTIILSDESETPLPFVIQDVTPRHLRVAAGTATEHPLRITGIDGVTVVVPELARSADALASLSGSEGAPTIPRIAGVRAARSFPVGVQWITIAEPDDSESDIRAYLEQRGAGPYEVAVRRRATAAESGLLLPTALMHGARIRIVD